MTIPIALETLAQNAVTASSCCSCEWKDITALVVAIVGIAASIFVETVFGVIGFALFGIVVLVLGAVMTFHSVRAGYASGRPHMASLLLNAIMDLFLFCIFFVGGLFFRRKKEIHKRLMVLAMVSLIIPAIARLPIPPFLIGWAILAFSLTGLIYDVVVLRQASFTNIAGVLLINVSTPLRFIIEETRAWQHFSEWIAR